jgi:hypothetical protein
VAIGALVLVAIALALPAVVALLRAKGELEDGRRAAVLGPNVTGVRKVTDVGLDLASVGLELADRAGAKSLHVVNGRFPIDEVRALSSQLDDALGTLDTSTTELDEINGPFIGGPLRDAVSTLDDRIQRAVDETATAAQAARLAPALFGADRQRRYFLAVVTPTELRGSGGIIGSYGIITIDNGQLHLDQLDTIEALNRKARKAPVTDVLPAIYRTAYSGFGAGSNLQNLTVTPDFPTAAAAIEAAYQSVGDGPVDGVISVDPIGLTSILKLTGSVRVKSWPDPIKPAYAEQILLFDQYVQLSGPTRDSFLGDVAHAVFDKLTTGSLPPPTEIARTLSGAVATGHIRLQSTTATEEALFTRIHSAGELARSGDDAVGLVTQNGSQSKIDYFLHRTLSYDVTVDPTTGAAHGSATITLRNDAPSGGLPDYILGGIDHGIVPGDNHIYVSLYSALSPSAVSIDGQSQGANVAQEQGRTVTTMLLVVPAGATRTVRIELSGNLPLGPNYELALDRQPVVNADHVEVHLHGAVARDWSFDLSTPTILRSDG